MEPVHYCSRGIAMIRFASNYSHLGTNHHWCDRYIRRLASRLGATPQAISTPLTYAISWSRLR